MTINEYTDICIEFAIATSNFGSLNEYKFYTTYNGNWIETCDNAHSGIDVSWAFHQFADTIREDAPAHFKKHFLDLVEQGIDENWNLELTFQ